MLTGDAQSLQIQVEKNGRNIFFGKWIDFRKSEYVQESSFIPPSFGIDSQCGLRTRKSQNTSTVEKFGRVEEVEEVPSGVSEGESIIMNWYDLWQEYWRTE